MSGKSRAGHIERDGRTFRVVMAALLFVAALGFLAGAVLRIVEIFP